MRKHLSRQVGVIFLFLTSACGLDHTATINSKDYPNLADEFKHQVKIVDKSYEFPLDADRYFTLYYEEQNQHVLLELQDGSLWEISSNYLDVISKWQIDDELLVTFDPSQSVVDQFRFIHPFRTLPWGNNEEAFGRPLGGLAKGNGLPDESTLKGSDAKEKFVTREESGYRADDRIYVLDSVDPEWPYILWNSSNREWYEVVEARLR